MDFFQLQTNRNLHYMILIRQCTKIDWHRSNNLRRRPIEIHSICCNNCFDNLY
jgi:hypothetical protein